MLPRELARMLKLSGFATLAIRCSSKSIYDWRTRTTVAFTSDKSVSTIFSLDDTVSEL